jgi:hypothetical protein
MKIIVRFPKDLSPRQTKAVNNSGGAVGDRSDQSSPLTFLDRVASGSYLI